MMNLSISSLFSRLLQLLKLPTLLSAQPPQRVSPVQVNAKYTQPDGRWPDSLRVQIRDSLARGRERWRDSRPREYLVSTISTWGMFRVVRTAEFDGQLEAAHVRGDSIVAIVHRPDRRFAPTPNWRTVSIDGVFLHLERAIESPDRQVQVPKI